MNCKKQETRSQNILTYKICEKIQSKGQTTEKKECKM